MPHFIYPVHASFFGFPEQRRTFSPKFDIHETDKAYVLEGELPGLEKSNLSIEFTDPVTLLIKGHTEKSYTTPSESPATVEKSSAPTSESRSSSPTRSLKPTVEDEKEEGSSSTPAVAAEAPSKKSVIEKQKEFRPRQWVSERTVGGFQRSFTFPAGIDQDAVTAGLEHGVLRIEVPKRAPVTRRIEIQ